MQPRVKKIPDLLDTFCVYFQFLKGSFKLIKPLHLLNYLFLGFEVTNCKFNKTTPQFLLKISVAHPDSPQRITTIRIKIQHNKNISHSFMNMCSCTIECYFRTSRVEEFCMHKMNFNIISNFFTQFVFLRLISFMYIVYWASLVRIFIGI